MRYPGRSLRRLLVQSAGSYEIPPTDPEEPALLHFTSGTTGTPKGALHVHEAVVAHHSTAANALGLRPTDVFWCTADPGWVTGTSYGIIAPLTHGATVVCDAGEFAAKRWYRILEQQRVTVWYTAPTALRMLMRAGADVVEGFDLSALRHIGSVGEPLNPEVVVWAQETYERPVLDNWWQTETGAIMIGNRPDLPVRPGSMGMPLPGVEATILARDESGSVLVDDCEVCEPVPAAPGGSRCGPGGPRCSAPTSARRRATSAASSAAGTLTGDLARRDEDGYFWFVGRGDDVIKSAGHLIGPFEVESALMEHPAVAEAGVIGKPDPVAGEVVKAFVTLRDGFEPTDDLRLDIVAFGGVVWDRSPPARWSSTSISPPAAARSCGAC